MSEKEHLVNSSLDGLIEEFAEYIPIERDEHGRFINKSKTSLRFGPVPASSPVVGDMWIESGLKGTTYVYDGSAWIQVGGSASVS